MSDGDIPDYVRDYIMRSSKAMEDIAEGLQKRDETDKQNEDKWRETIATMNREFIVHQVDTGNKIKELCTSISIQTDGLKQFQTDVVQTAKEREARYWDLIMKVVFVALIIIGGTLAARVLVPGFG